MGSGAAWFSVTAWLLRAWIRLGTGTIAVRVHGHRGTTPLARPEGRPLVRAVTGPPVRFYWATGKVAVLPEAPR
ncbi:hypothetical protein NJ76_01515 [Rhodococcus sp. IITR03]|nr:hypothetical protein NJ76_01515 [Rhodococcus sp. IITR03]